MLGNIDEAKRTSSRRSRPPIAIRPTPAFATATSACARGCILETEKWEKIALECTAAHRRAGDAHAGMPGMPSMAAAGQQHLDLHRRLQRGEARRLDDRRTPPKRMLRGAREKAEARPESPTAARSDRDHGEAGGARSSPRRGARRTRRCKLAKEAMDIELALSAPSGPPDPIKPAPGVLRRAADRGRKTRGSRCRTWNFRCSGPRTGRLPSKLCSGPALRARQCDNYGNPKLRLRTLDPGLLMRKLVVPGARRVERFVCRPTGVRAAERRRADVQQGRGADSFRELHVTAIGPATLRRCRCSPTRTRVRGRSRSRARLPTARCRRGMPIRRTAASSVRAG